MGLYVVSGVIVSIIALRCYLRYFKWGRCRCPNSMKDKSVIITGANSGLGRESTKELVKRGAKVIMACRDVTLGCSAAADIQQLTGCDLSLLTVKQLDLASFQSIRKFADDVIKSDVEIDVLINNAGVCRCPLGQTQEGFEMQFGVNYLGHFLLTSLLKDRIKSRIIFVNSSLAKYGDIPINFDKFIYKNLLEKGGYEPRAAYNDSKLALALYARRLARLNNGVAAEVLSVSPGMVWTNLGRHSKLGVASKAALLMAGILFVRTANEGVQSIVHCAVSEQCAGRSGAYYRDCRESDQGLPFDECVDIRLSLMSEHWTKR